MKYLFLTGLTILASACANDSPSFRSMSEMELLAYNRARPIEKQVYCMEEPTTSTFIRKRICQTYEDWITANERAANTLDVLNATPVFNFPSTIE